MNTPSFIYQRIRIVLLDFLKVWVLWIEPLPMQDVSFAAPPEVKAPSVKVGESWDVVKLSVPKDEVYSRARLLILEAKTNTHTSGESKRHQVYAQLIKEFPKQYKRHLALVIETVLQGL